MQNPCRRLTPIPTSFRIVASRSRIGHAGAGGRAMTEQEWEKATDPTPMLKALWGKASDRKMRRFLCTCCARVLGGTPVRRRYFRGYYAGSFQNLKRALGVVEQFAEGLVGPDALTQARRDAADSVYVPPSIDYGG